MGLALSNGDSNKDIYIQQDYSFNIIGMLCKLNDAFIVHNKIRHLLLFWKLQYLWFLKITKDLKV